MGLAAVTVGLATVCLWWCLLVQGRADGIVCSDSVRHRGFVCAEVIDVLDTAVEPELVNLIAEMTLDWVLCVDASRVPPGKFRGDQGMYARLLGVGLPLPVAVGTLVAIVVLGLDPWAALLVGAALAPTDAALGASVMSIRVCRSVGAQRGERSGRWTLPPQSCWWQSRRRRRGGHRRRRWTGASGHRAASGGAGRSGDRRRRWGCDPAGPPPGLAVGGTRWSGRAGAGAAGLHRGAARGLATASSPRSSVGWCSAAPPGEVERKEVYFVEQSGDLVSMVSWLIFGALAVPAIGEWIEVANRRLRGTQPHRGPDAAGRAIAPRRAASIVSASRSSAGSATRAGVGHLRAARTRGPARRSPEGGRDHRADRPAQRRRHGFSASHSPDDSQASRAAATNSGRSRHRLRSDRMLIEVTRRRSRLTTAAATEF